MTATLIREAIINGIPTLTFDFDALCALPPLPEEECTAPPISARSAFITYHNRKDGLHAHVPVDDLNALSRMDGVEIKFSNRPLIPIRPDEADQKAAYNSLRTIYQVVRCNTPVAPYTTASALRHLRGTAVAVSWTSPEVPGGIRTPYRHVKRVTVDEKRRIVRLEGSDWHVELSGLTCWYARKGAVVLHNGKLSGGLVLSITA